VEGGSGAWKKRLLTGSQLAAGLHPRPPPLPGWQSPGSIPSPGSGSAAPRNAPDAVRQVRAGAVDVHRLQRREHLRWGAGGWGMRGDTCDGRKERLQGTQLTSEERETYFCGGFELMIKF